MNTQIKGVLESGEEKWYVRDHSPNNDITLYAGQLCDVFDCDRDKLVELHFYRANLYRFYSTCLRNLRAVQFLDPGRIRMDELICIHTKIDEVTLPTKIYHTELDRWVTVTNLDSLLKNNISVRLT